MLSWLFKNLKRPYAVPRMGHMLFIPGVHTATFEITRLPRTWRIIGFGDDTATLVGPK